jgi:hypothetical protein
MMRIFKSKEQNFLDAAKKGNLYRMKYNIINDVNPEVKNEYGRTALNIASENPMKFDHGKSRDI